MVKIWLPKIVNFRFHAPEIIQDRIERRWFAEIITLDAS